MSSVAPRLFPVLLSAAVLTTTVTAWGAEQAPGKESRLDAQLAAGEFGPALTTAQGIKDPQERDRALRQIADAQGTAGEFDAARLTARRMSTSQARVQTRGENRRRQEFAGGGSGADFGPLIELIQNQTGGPPDGPWQEIDGEGGTIGQFETGVRVDPHGLLYQLSRQELTGRLQALGLKARAAALNKDMARASSLRMVSLTRLEQAVAERVAAGEPVVETMKHLAGLSRIEYVLVFPEEHEIVIAGPAEAWQYNSQGLPVGVSSGRPTLQLDDLVTVFRTFAPGGKGIFGCSINPRPENLKAVKEFAESSQAKGALSPTGVSHWLKQIETKMGLQDVEIYGVPADTRVSRVLVEADYRMKLIGIGKLDGGKNIPNVFELFAALNEQNPPSLDALRWWLSLKYEAILHSPSRDVFEIQGSSVLVQSEDQIVTGEGTRIQTGKSTGANRQFAANFTAHYQELAKRDLVFADLQNIFDMAMVAALCQEEGLADKSGWDLGSFARGGEYQVASVAAPATVHSVLNHRLYGGKNIVVQVAGGVRADVKTALKDESVTRESAALTGVQRKAKAPQLPAGRWWWDAAE